MIFIFLLALNIINALGQHHHHESKPHVFDITLQVKDAKPGFFCKILKLPFEGKKQYKTIQSLKIGDFDPVENLHESAIYTCAKGREYTETERDCDLMFVANSGCTGIQVSMQWKVLNNNMTFNEDETIPLGDASRSRYILILNHFAAIEDAFLHKDVKYGIRLWHSHRPNTKEINYMVHLTVPFYFGNLIPPHQEDFINIAICDSSCFREEHPQGIEILWAQPHTHFGHKVLTRHFRNGTELPHIWEANYPRRNNSYMHLQLARLPKPVKVLVDDIVVTECYYDTTDQNETTVQRNTGIPRDDMCGIAFYVSPPISQTSCFSSFTKKTLNKIAGIEDFTNYWTQNEPIIEKPLALKGIKLLDRLRNTTDFGKDIQNIVRFSEQQISCDTNVAENMKFHRVSYPDAFIPKDFHKESEKSDKHISRLDTNSLRSNTNSNDSTRGSALEQKSKPLEMKGNATDVKGEEKRHFIEWKDRVAEQNLRAIEAKKVKERADKHKQQLLQYYIKVFEEEANEEDIKIEAKRIVAEKRAKSKKCESGVMPNTEAQP